MATMKKERSLHGKALKPEDTDVMWMIMTKLKNMQQAATDLTVPTKYASFTLQEEQSLCFLKA